MKRTYVDIFHKTTHTSRSFFVYVNGDLFCQLSDREICTAKPDDAITLNMRGAIIRGKFVKSSGTGIILSDWTIERK